MTKNTEDYKTFLEGKLETFEKYLLEEKDREGGEYWEGYYSGRIDQIKRTLDWLL